MSLSPSGRRIACGIAVAVAALQIVYGITLAIGLALLPSPAASIADPMFTLLELLIIAIAPLIVLLMVAVHAWAADDRKPAALAAVAFAMAMATVTCAVHAVVLVMSRDPSWTALPWSPLMLSFTWPSISYVLDILAWDLFFALSAFCAAAVFVGDRAARRVRIVLIVAGALALFGLVGAAMGDMSWRNLGIVGYLPVFAAAVILMARIFVRTETAAQV